MLMRALISLPLALVATAAQPKRCLASPRGMRASVFSLAGSDSKWFRAIAHPVVVRYSRPTTPCAGDRRETMEERTPEYSRGYRAGGGRAKLVILRLTRPRTGPATNAGPPVTAIVGGVSCIVVADRVDREVRAIEHSARGDAKRTATGLTVTRARAATGSRYVNGKRSRNPNDAIINAITIRNVRLRCLCRGRLVTRCVRLLRDQTWTAVAYPRGVRAPYTGRRGGGGQSTVVPFATVCTHVPHVSRVRLAGRPGSRRV